jgi:hypothetical protein
LWLRSALPGNKTAASNGRQDWAELASGLARCHSGGLEIVFNVAQEGDGGFVAECLSHDIFTEGDTWEQLRDNVRKAVSAFFFDQPKPAGIRLHLVRDEVLACA